MVLIAAEFKRAGHEVLICGASEFSKIAEDFGVPFEPYPHNYTELYLEQQKIGYIHNMRENIKHQEGLFKGECKVLSKIAPDFDVLFNLVHEVFVPSIAEAFGLANIKLMTMPVFYSDRYGAPASFPIVTENKAFNHLTWRGAELAARHLFSYYRTINGLREQLGLSPLNDLLTRNGTCDHMLMGVYEELMPPCPSWKFDYSYIGPSVPNADVKLSEPLEAFLAAGDAPIYIGFGSMTHEDAPALTRALVQSARDAGVRILLARAKGDIGAGLEDSEDVYLLKEYPIPHHVLFPRCRAALHHGSWIMTNMATQAGIPQIVAAQASDQYTWRQIVYKRGLGPKGIDMNRLRPRDVSRAIEAAVSNPSYAENARALADRVRGMQGQKNAVEDFDRIEPGLKSRR